METAALGVAQAGATPLPPQVFAPPFHAAAVGAEFYLVEAASADPQVAVTGLDGEVVLFIARYDPVTGAWVALPTAWNATLGQVSAVTDRLGLFRVVLYTAVDIPLGREWNTLTYPGPDGLAAAELAARLGGAVEAIYRFNASMQVWESYRPGVPAALNSLQRVRTGDELFVRLQRGGVLRLPDLIQHRAHPGRVARFSRTGRGTIPSSCARPDTGYAGGRLDELTTSSPLGVAIARYPPVGFEVAGWDVRREARSGFRRVSAAARALR